MNPSQDGDSIRAHPRRRPFRLCRPSLVSSQEPSSSSQPPLRKGETFHPSLLRSSDRDCVLPLLPRRSPTCPGALEAIAAGQQRMSNILDRLDLDSFESFSSKDNDDLPVPRGLLNIHMKNSQSRNDGSSEPRSRRPSVSKEIPAKTQRAHCHASDSGLGTSISSRQSMSSSNKVKSGQLTATPGLPRSQSAITRSITTLESEASPKHKLSASGRTEIEKHVFEPLFQDVGLKAYHPLLENVRQQIEDDRISSLRDLEKTVFSLAPSVKTHNTAYVRFCQYTILCLGQTVSFLNGRDLCMPTDRQYTNGYFVDLLDQVTRFKRMRDEMRNNYNGEGSSKAAGKRPAFKEPQLIIEGGISRTGRPLELVAQKDGEAISMRTGKPFEEHSVPSMKRALSYGSADESAQRSMARRKKNAPPMNINKKCKDCDKVFSRPCDLTKHEKSHTRPFKCPVPSCKYHTKGWATEKESERHYNDKHSDSPRLYACQFESCSYKSKRESNCKQHMEKTHGWVYMRSKNNGRNTKRGGSTQQSPTPSGSAVEPKLEYAGWDIAASTGTPEFHPESTTWDVPSSETPEFSFNAFQPQMTSMATPVTGTVDLVTPTTGTINSPSEPFDMAPENTAFSIHDIFPDAKASDGVLFAGDLDFPDFSNAQSMFNDYLTPFPDLGIQPQEMSYTDIQPQYGDDSAGFLLDMYNDMQSYGLPPNGI